MGLLNSPSIATNGLILCLDAANARSYPGTGTTWSDVSGYGSGLNGALTNTPTYSTTNKGIFTFNGTNQYVLVGALTSSLTTSMSFSIWFNTSSLAASQTLWWDDDGQSGGDSWVTIGTNGLIQTNRDTDGYGVLTSASTVAINTWYNLCFVANGASGKILYLNGVADASNAVAIASRSTRSYISIGVKMPYPPTPSSDYFNGSIGPFSVYNRALTVAEIQQNFNAHRGRFGV